MATVAEGQIPYAEVAAIAVDGVRDELAWASAWPVPGPFVTYDPVSDAAPLGATEVWITSDARALYLFIAATGPEPDKVRASLGRRDTRFEDDLVAVYLDPTGRGQRAYLFAVTAAGVQGDGVLLASGDEDTSW